MAMKKSHRILVLCLTVVVVLIGAVVAMLMTFKAGMRLIPTGEVIPGVYAVKDGIVNMYVVKGGAGAIAIDAAMDADHVAAGLKQIGLDARAISAVFLTHSDSDHVGGIAAMPNAAVYMSKAEEQMVDGRTKRMLFFSNHLARAHQSLDDGQTLPAAGMTVKCIATPGHTPGSMSFIVNGMYLFTGDTLRIHDGKAALFNRFINMDTDTQIRSIAALSALTGITHVFTAHHGFSADFRTLFADYLKTESFSRRR